MAEGLAIGATDEPHPAATGLLSEPAVQAWLQGDDGPGLTTRAGFTEEAIGTVRQAAQLALPEPLSGFGWCVVGIQDKSVELGMAIQP